MRIVCLALFLFGLARGVAGELERGVIGGARFVIARPEKWEGKLVLLAHGYRPKDAALAADLDPDDGFTGPLVKDGWLVAATSYRRNGWIIEDAIADLKGLREHVVKQHGEVRRCVVSGNSMGGLIAVLVAEGAMDGIDGVVGIGTYLGDGRTDAFYPTLTWKPRAPVLFLTNQSELDHPKRYRETAGAERTALWVVKRNGHCNTSSAERLQAVMAVDGWIGGKVPGKDLDGTVPPPERPSTAKRIDGALEGTIRASSAAWGNLSTDFVAADLTALGSKMGETVVVSAGEKQLEAKRVGYRSDVPEGGCALYLTADGWVEIQINGGNAAEKLGVSQGDRLRLSR